MTRRVWTWRKIRVDKKLLEPLGQSFELGVYTAVLQHDPENVPILVEVGDLYTRMGRLQEGLAIDERLVKILPKEPIFHYNLACSQSLLGRTSLALLSLQRAIELGYHNLEHLWEDSDLENLRQDPRFGELLEKLRDRSDTKSKQE